MTHYSLGATARKVGPETPAHRRQRRSRTRARTDLRAYTTGSQIAAARVQRAIQVLSTHHSNSGLPQLARDKLLAGSMAGKGQDGGQSWRCSYCKQYQKKGAMYCQSCGWAKQDVAETSGWHNAGAETYWQQGWEQPKSPRHQRPWSPRRRRMEESTWVQHAQHAGKGGGKSDKGKGKHQAPGINSLPSPPQVSIGTGPKPNVVTTGAASSSDRQTLDKVLRAMAATRDTLSPELQELLNAHQHEETAATEKTLHKVVKAQATARKELGHLCNGRAQYCSAWANYVCKVAETAQAQVQEHAEVMKSYAEKEEQWEQALAEATSELAALAKSGPVVINLEEDSDAMVEDAIVREQSATEALAKQQEGTDKLLHALQEARQQAVDSVKESERERTPRRRKEETTTDLPPGVAS